MQREQSRRQSRQSKHSLVLETLVPMIRETSWHHLKSRRERQMGSAEDSCKDKHARKRSPAKQFVNYSNFIYYFWSNDLCCHC